jgi:hypothetical protein
LKEIFMNRLIGIGLALGAIAAVGCSSVDSDWSHAQSVGTAQAYQNFVNAHTNDPRVAQARQQIQKLQDDQAWADAQSANTAAAFRQYIQSQPNGTYLAQARQSVAELERAAAWKVAEANGSEASLKAFLAQYSQGPEADQARAKLKELDHYRVELASYHSKQQAEKERAKLQERYGNTVHELVVVAGSAKHSDIESAPMSLADAQSACATLESEHQRCQVLTTP